MLSLGDQQMLVSVPLELSTDHSSVLEQAKVRNPRVGAFIFFLLMRAHVCVCLCAVCTVMSHVSGCPSLLRVTSQASACASVSGLTRALGWTPERARAALNFLLHQGLVWIDVPPPAVDSSSSFSSSSFSSPSEEASYWFPALFVDARDLARDVARAVDDDTDAELEALAQQLDERKE